MAEIAAQCGFSDPLIPSTPKQIIPEETSQPAATAAAKKLEKNRKKRAQKNLKKSLKPDKKKEDKDLEKALHKQEQLQGHFSVVEARVVFYMDCQKNLRGKYAENQILLPQWSEMERALAGHSFTANQLDDPAKPQACLKFLNQRSQHHCSLGTTEGDLDMLIMNALSAHGGQTVVEDWSWLEDQSWRSQSHFASVERTYLDMVRSQGRIPANQLDLPVILHDFHAFTFHEDFYEVMKECLKKYTDRQTIIRGFTADNDNRASYFDVEKQLVQVWRRNPGWQPSEEARAEQKVLFGQWCEMFLTESQAATDQETFEATRLLSRAAGILSNADSQIVVFDAFALKEIITDETSDTRKLYVIQAFPGLVE